MHRVILGSLLVLTLSTSATAQEWAKKMFEVTSHDFGTVAKGAKVDFGFKFQNKYEEDVHVEYVSSSCGCTTPTIAKNTLKTWETGEVLATFNTSAFLGHKDATITVKIDKPFSAIVQLHVQGDIRGDVVFTPGAVDLGSVDRGTTMARKVAVTHNGQSDWQIVDIRSTNAHFEVAPVLTGRTAGQVSYELLVKLKPDAPIGYIKEQLYLITNDPQVQQIPLDVEGRVVPEITVTPAPLMLGMLHPGQQITKQLIVKGKKPFKIVDIQCDDPGFTCAKPEEAKTQHIISVTYVAGDAAGKIAKKVEIKTDLNEEPVELTFSAQIAATTAKTEAASITKPE
jgi:hypothetical protein